MNHIEKISRSLEEHNLDAMLITSEPGECYALGFQGEGWLLVGRQGAHYSTDGRYIEAAQTGEGSPALSDLGPEGTSVPGQGLYPCPEI